TTRAPRACGGRSRGTRPERRSLHQNFPSRPGWPLAKYLLSLQSAHAKLAEAVEGRVHAEKSFQDVGEDENARAGKLVLVEFEIDEGAAGEADAVLRQQRREVRFALHRADALNLPHCEYRVGEIVELQQFLQGLTPIG